MRGTDLRAAAGIGGVGITPACAGNSIPPWCRVRPLEDHPRVCGEQPHLQLVGPDSLGSPPRVRGTVKDPLLDAVDMGITPACAGNRGTARWTRCCWKDHPRVCGEQVRLRHKGGGGKGTPTRVRGTGYPPGAAFARLRITPACAGNRSASAVKEAEEKDHPRVCGEQQGFRRHVEGLCGSPPRVRGTALRCSGRPSI